MGRGCFRRRRWGAGFGLSIRGWRGRWTLSWVGVRALVRRGAIRLSTEFWFPDEEWPPREEQPENWKKGASAHSRGEKRGPHECAIRVLLSGTHLSVSRTADIKTGILGAFEGALSVALGEGCDGYNQAVAFSGWAVLASPTWGTGRNSGWQYSASRLHSR